MRRNWLMSSNVAEFLSFEISAPGPKKSLPA